MLFQIPLNGAKCEGNCKKSLERVYWHRDYIINYLFLSVHIPRLDSIYLHPAYTRIPTPLFPRIPSSPGKWRVARTGHVVGRVLGDVTRACLVFKHLVWGNLQSVHAHFSPFVHAYIHPVRACIYDLFSLCMQYIQSVALCVRAYIQSVALCVRAYIV